MELEKAIQVLKNIEIEDSRIACKECVFTNFRRCIIENEDCQLKAIETVLKELDKLKQDNYKLSKREEIIYKREILEETKDKIMEIFDNIITEEKL